MGIVRYTRIDGDARLSHRDRDKDKNKRGDDRPPPVNVKQSILELRKIYSSLTDREFAAMYESRYGVRAATVIAVLEKGDGT